MRLNWNGREGEGYEWRLGGQKRRGLGVGGVGDLGLRLREKKERERGKEIYRAKRRSMYSQWPQQPQDVAPVHLYSLLNMTLSEP